MRKEQTMHTTILKEQVGKNSGKVYSGTVYGTETGD